MLSLKQNLSYALLMLVYIGLNIALMAENQYWLALLPAAIMIGWLTIYRPDKVVLFIAMAVPLSIKVNFEQYGLSINLPTEPLLIILTGLFWLKMFTGWRYDARIIRHPITVAILINLAWVLITACTSSMFIVSLKFFIARCWFITVAYFMCILLFKQYGNIKAFIWLFCSTLLFAIGWSLTRHAAQLFEQSYATRAPLPFFPDHGVYAAVISLFIPVIILFILKRGAFGLTVWQQFFAVCIALMLIVGTVFSFTRAAWIGLGVSAGFLVILLLRIRLRTLFIIGGIGLAVLSVYKTDIYFKLKSNKTVSTSNLEGHVRSIYNISTDASNTERINRWSSAFRMWKERPILGWGPGTYMFQYAPYQLSSEMTVISTRTGTLGNAHSEYIEPLVESGVIGMLSFVLILVFSVSRSMSIIYYCRDKKVKFMAMGAILGLITYYTHGLLNDYLDMDKAAVPFWALTGIITALDIYYYKSGQINPAD